MITSALIGSGARGRVDQSDQIKMLRMPRERRELRPADTEEYAARSSAQCLSGRDKVIDLDPMIPGDALPRRALKRKQRNGESRAGRNRMCAHLRSKRMRGIDHTRDLFAAKIVDQPIDAAKAANTPGIGGCFGLSVRPA